MERWIMANGDNLQIILFFAFLGIFGVAEAIVPRRVSDRMRGRRWITNFSLTALNIVILGLLPVTFFGAAAWAREHRAGLFNQIAMPLGVVVIGNLLARGFISFFTHFLMHKVPAFWRVHRVHHLDTEMDVSTTVRFHPIEFLIALVPGVPLVIAFGLTPWLLMVYELADAVITLFSHANVSLPALLERLVRRIIVTPDLHRVHHSSHQPETDSNFGAVLPIWDIVFGTFRTASREPQNTMRLGLAEVRDGREQKLLWLLVSQIRKGRRG